jgi:hypothetical protein
MTALSGQADPRSARREWLVEIAVNSVEKLGVEPSDFVVLIFGLNSVLRLRPDFFAVIRLLLRSLCVF